MNNVDIDFKSIEWKKIRAFVTGQKLDFLTALAVSGLSERTADELRGGVKLCEALLSLDYDSPTVPSDIYK